MGFFCKGCLFVFFLLFAVGLDHITGLFQQPVAQSGGQFNSTASKEAFSVRESLVLGVEVEGAWL